MMVYLWVVLTILMTQQEPSSKQTKRSMDLVQLPDAGCLRATKRKTKNISHPIHHDSSNLSAAILRKRHPFSAILKTDVFYWNVITS